jgi:hypothetical protein
MAVSHLNLKEGVMKKVLVRNVLLLSLTGIGLVTSLNLYLNSNYRVASILFTKGEFAGRVMGRAFNKGAPFIRYLIQSDIINENMVNPHFLIELIDVMSLDQVIEFIDWSEENLDSETLTVRLAAMLIYLKVNNFLDESSIVGLLNYIESSKSHSHNRAILILTASYYKDKPNKILEWLAKEVIFRDATYRKTLSKSLEAHMGSTDVSNVLVRSLKAGVAGDEALNLLLDSNYKGDVGLIANEFAERIAKQTGMAFQCRKKKGIYFCSH